MGIFSLFKKRKLDEVTAGVRRRYLETVSHKTPAYTPLREISFTVLDTETSGLDKNRDRILSIAAVKVTGFGIQVETLFEEMIGQDYSPGDEVKVHGILGRHLVQASSEKDALMKLLSYINNDVIVGHHIGFDIALINRALDHHYCLKLKNKILDTAVMAQRIENPHLQNSKHPSLDDLCHKYNVPVDDRHTASGDTFMTALVFLKLCGKLEQRGVDKLSDL